MEQGIGLTLLTLLSTAGLVALFTVLRLLFPGMVGHTRSAFEEMPGRSFLVGTVNLLFIGAVALGLAALSDGLNTEFFLFPAALLAGFLALGILVGLAAMVDLIGARMLPERTSTSQILWGGVVVVLGCLTPFLGWFILFPYLSLAGLGGVLLGWFRRMSAPSAGSVLGED